MRTPGAGNRGGLTGMILLLLLGCSPVPESTRVTVGHPGAFASIRRHPGVYRGRPALLGGRIVRVVTLDNRTRIEIDCLPLDDDERPIGEARGEGRFLAEIPEKVSPGAYPWGRLATVWGTFAGTAEGRPLVAATRVYVWPHRYGGEPLYPPAPYREGSIGAGWDPGWWW